DYSNNPVTVSTSYAYNYELWIAGIPMQNVPNANTAMLMDGDGTYNLQAGVWYGNLNASNKKNDVDKFNQSIVAKRHTKKFNILFLDCHAEWQSTLSYNSLLPDWQ